MMSLGHGFLCHVLLFYSMLTLNVSFRLRFHMVPKVVASSFRLIYCQVQVNFKNSTDFTSLVLIGPHAQIPTT